MRRPSARVGQNRRRAFLYAPWLVIGAAVFLVAAPVLNGATMLGALVLMAGAAGFVVEADARH